MQVTNLDKSGMQAEFAALKAKERKLLRKLDAHTEMRSKSVT